MADDQPTQTELTAHLVNQLKLDVSERMRLGDRSPEVLSMLERIEKLETRLAMRLRTQRLAARHEERRGRAR